MSRQLIDYDPQTRRSTWHDYDELTDETTIYSEQDVTHILDSAQEFRSSGLDFKGDKREFWLAARIPDAIIAQWLKEGVSLYDKNDWPEIKKRLNSSEYAKLRMGVFNL